MLRLVKIVPLDSVKMVKDKLRASNAALVNSTMLLVLVPVNYVSTRLTLVEKEETVVALSVQLGGRPKKTAVPNVKLVVLERMVPGVKCVVRVNIVRAVWMLFVVKIVRLVSVKVTKDKRRASNAALVNSMTLLVLLHASHVQRRSILVKKEETVVALNAQLGLATKPNVRQYAMRCHRVPTV